MTKKHRALNFALVCFIVVAISAVATYLIIIANGYKINLQAKKLEKTGMIYLRYDPRDSKVYLDGVIQQNKDPLPIQNLLAKRYTVEVKKDLYNTWSKTINVESGQISDFENIILFLQNPKISDANIDEQQKLANSETTEATKASGLKIVSGELYWGEDLITRLSDLIIIATFYTDKKHIAYQIKNEIRIMDLDGSNDFKLIALASDNPSYWIFTDSGKNMIYQDGNSVKKAEIK